MEIKNKQRILFRTDLAKDEYERYHNDNIIEASKKLGDFENKEFKLKGINVTKSIVGENASKKLNKSVGTYYTIDLENVNIHDSKTLENTEYALSDVLKEIIKQNNLVNKKALVVGLGNANVTPDAIGPYAIDNIVVTRHLEIINSLSDGFSSVCAMSPGVMGSTGIETYDIIESVLNKVNVDYIIVVDALATSSIKRINKTIQITDTGIRPGSGVGNQRKELSKNTLGIPVIAIGVPTVVDATTIATEAIKMVINHLSSKIKNKGDIDETFFGIFGSLDDIDRYELVEEVLTKDGYNLMVTPKEIDVEVNDLSKIIANGINLALHDGLYNGLSE